MSTPKEASNIKQKLKSKKNTFVRLLQTPISSRFELKDEKIKGELEKTLQLLKTQQNANKTPKKKKVFKSSEFVVGLNESLRLIKKGKAACVFISNNIAHNLSGVLNKLCSTNQVYYLYLDLEILKQILNLQTLVVVTLKKTVTEKESKLHSIYQTMLKNVPNKAAAASTSQSVEVKKEQIQVPKAKPKATDFYVAKHLDLYSQMMKQKLAKTSTSENASDEFRSQTSFIKFSSSADVFVDYSKQFQDKIIINFFAERNADQETVAQASTRLLKRIFEDDEESKFTTPVVKHTKKQKLAK